MPVGMPAQHYLHEFGRYVEDAFGHTAYHVGSSLRLKDGWRDVDVRVLLPNAEYYGVHGFLHPDRKNMDAKLVATELAWSAFGRALTGLPIDFQIQPIAWANERFGRAAGGERSALGMTPGRFTVDSIAEERARSVLRAGEPDYPSPVPAPLETT